MGPDDRQPKRASEDLIREAEGDIEPTSPVVPSTSNTKETETYLKWGHAAAEMEVPIPRGEDTDD